MSIATYVQRRDVRETFSIRAEAEADDDLAFRCYARRILHRQRRPESSHDAESHESRVDAAARRLRRLLG